MTGWALVGLCFLAGVCGWISAFLVCWAWLTRGCGSEEFLVEVELADRAQGSEGRDGDGVDER